MQLVGLCTNILELNFSLFLDLYSLQLTNKVENKHFFNVTIMLEKNWT